MDNHKIPKGGEKFTVEGDDALEREMAAYDALPARARLALKYTKNLYSAIQITDMIETMGEDEVLNLLRRG